MNTGRRRDKIPCASALKSSNLFGHGKLPSGMTSNIPIRTRLKDNRKTIVNIMLPMLVFSRRSSIHLNCYIRLCSCILSPKNQGN
jgi:hypothetical protein